MSWNSLSERVQRFLALETSDPELIQAQSASLSRLVPIMYLVGIASSVILAIAFYASAPLVLSIGTSAALSAICVARLATWWRASTPDQSLREMLKLPARTIAFSVTFSIWAAMLFPHGDEFAKTHAALVVLVMIVTSMFCLSNVKRAAMLGAAMAGSIMSAFLFLEGGRASVMALYIVVVIVLMVFVAELQNRDFRRNIEARKLAASAQRRSETLADENVRLANLDFLTQLPNRRAFFNRLNQAVETAGRAERRLAVGIIDLDGFKPVNDLHGHSVGDRLLTEVGQRLARIAATRGFFIARLGGDEFAFILEDLWDDAGLTDCGNAICQLLSEPYTFHDTAIRISASAGIAVYPAFAPDPQQLFERADYALYHGKAVQRGTAVLFSSEHEAQFNDNALIEQTLKTADLEAELVMEFQPIIETRSNAVLGFEALARWESSVLGRISPSRFIPVAERAGIIGQLTRPLLRKALAAALNWPGNLRLSFNLSAHDLNSPERIVALIAIIDGSGFDPHRLDLEITETAFVHDFGQVRRSTELLRRLGCGISLDDFGTGYSSLLRLHDLPLTKIKIDRSFITDLGRSSASHKIIKSLLALSQDMGLECVIEGVETQQEMALLERLGGRIVQGYYYSPPIPEAEVPHYLHRHERERAGMRATA